MKKTVFLLILVGILSVSALANAEVLKIGSNYLITDTVNLKTTFVNQDPYPAETGGYVNLLFKLENWGTNKAENVTFELLSKYPFSLDTGVSAINELGTVGGSQTDENAFLIKYKVRVDKDAVDGENKIGVRYTYGNSMSYTLGTFNVTVSNPRTDFDVVAQDSTASSTTLAIANIGANDAYSVIVRIPEQENYGVTGTSASIIGSLTAGDYTLVSFQITSNAIANISDRGGRITPGMGGGTAPNITFVNRTANNISMTRGGKLAVEISYTDTLGIRRTVQKEVSLDMSGTTGTRTTTQITQGSQSQILSGGLMYIVIGAVGIILVVIFFKFSKRKKK
ncbi:MAG: hypothetical protein NT129_06270 [Candidatus Aenigmarchaeota archaeon]|nr:hypothetical protein [Candidatus Aenigmarchaeota archaeon]